MGESTTIILHTHLNFNVKHQNVHSTNVKTLEKMFLRAPYEGKSLNKRNATLKCMKNYAQGKILFRDTKWLLSNMSYRGGDDQAVWACAVGRTKWPLHCQLAPWKSFLLEGIRKLWTGGPSVLRSRGTMSKNKTQTISVSTLVKKLL